jgi:probable blue pigment (indigoidine) exporter
MVSVRANWHAVAITAIAPITWASTYPVIRHLLPADEPITTALIRALPAGILLLLISRRRPHGHWWWRSVVLGILNFAAFFVLTTVSAHLLPSSVATVTTTAGPVFMILLAWAILRERPTIAAFAGAALGIIGVVLLVGAAAGTIDPLGVAASLGAMILSSIGSILARKWSDGTPLIASTGWQLIAGGLILLPLALALEGVPAVPTPIQFAGYAWISLVATAIAFVAWFAGLRALPAQRVGIVGLLNPVTGVLLGTLIAGEHLAGLQWIAVAIVLGGVVVGQLGARPARSRGAVRLDRGASAGASPARPAPRSALDDEEAEHRSSDREHEEHDVRDDHLPLAAARMHDHGPDHDDREADRGDR